MAPAPTIIPVFAASDGVHIPPAQANLHRNDNYFELGFGRLWAEEIGRTREGVTFRLNHLPAGYSGYEYTRTIGDRPHIDRCMSFTIAHFFTC